MVEMCFVCRVPMEFFIKKNGYRIFRCPTCKLGKTEFPNHYEQFVRKFYQKGYFTGDPTCGAFTQYEQDKSNVVRNLQVIVNHLKRYIRHGKLLDAGCAMGYMVETALNSGFQAYGFDPSSYAISRSDRVVGKRLKESTISSATYPKSSFDVITLTDVFEHLDDPLAGLRKLNTFLKPKGFVVIATGNTNSLAAKILGWRWTFYIPPQHLYFFNKENLTTTLRLGGFEPVHWFSIGKWLSVGYILHLMEVSSHVTGARNIGKLMRTLGLDNLPLFVPLMDNMVVVAQKKYVSNI